MKKVTMKQLLFLVLFLFGVAGTSQAQVCKLPNSDDTVEVFSATFEGNNKVKVVVSNDSQEVSANVTVTVRVTYVGTRDKITKEFTDKGRALPNQSTEILIAIDETCNGRMPKSVEAISITGTKCK
ncbi:MAG: hypothetical protein K2H79_06615 [Bacteroidaceae bacterium]|nr:hypothetical protein [Bacteroidaceae bacterium]